MPHESRSPSPLSDPLSDPTSGPIRRWLRHLHALTRLVEFNLVLFALLLNFAWEILQVPLFEQMAGAPHWSAILACSRATLGDAIILLAAYWSTAVLAGGRRWIVAPSGAQLAWFVSYGVAVTIGIEWLALRGGWFTAWRYSALMPVLPGIGIGLSPLLQWIVLPLLTVWFVKRQLAQG